MYLIKSELTIVAFLIVVLALMVKVGYGVWASLPLWCALVVMLIVFRNPKRRPPPSPLAVVSPIDATVERIVHAKDPYQDKERIIIRLSRRYVGIMGLYGPTEGQVMQTWYGEQFKRPAAETGRDRGHIYTTWIQTDEKDDVLVSFYRCRTRRYLESWFQPGERVGQGKVVGLSSVQYVDVLLPVCSNIIVKAGDSIRAGESIMAKLVHRPKRTVVQ